MDSPPTPADSAALPKIAAQPRRAARVAARRRVDSGPPPRPGTGHVLLLLAGAAVYLSVLRAMAESPLGWIGLSVISLQSFVVGAAWAGLAVFVSRRWRRVSWPLEPGQWLLAVCGWELGVEVLLDLLNSGVGRPLVVASNVAGVLTCLALLAPTFSRGIRPVWRILFLALTLLYAAPYLLNVAVGWFSASEATAVWAAGGVAYRPLLSLPLLAAAELADWRVRKSWLHWTGVAVWSAAASLRIFLLA